MSKLKLGQNPRISNKDYHSDTEFLSSSDLKLILKNPKQFYKEKILGQKENKDAPHFDEGSFLHAMILEPHTIDIDFAQFPGFIKRGAEWDIFKAREENKNKPIISRGQKQRLDMWYAAYKNRPEAVSIIKGGQPELSLCAELHGIPIKVRTDYINVDEGYIVDIKTSGYSVDRDSFVHTMDIWGYGLSAALYSKIAEMIFNKKFDFYFIAVSKKNIDCQVYKLSEKTRKNGEEKILEAIKKYKKCKKTNVWTSDEDIVTIDTEHDYEILEV